MAKNEPSKNPRTRLELFATSLLWWVRLTGLLGALVTAPHIGADEAPSLTKSLSVDERKPTNQVEMLRARLINAVQSNLTEEVVAILKAEPSLSLTTNSPWQPPLLIQCARHLNPEMIKAFVEAGAPPDPPGAWDTGPLGITLEPLLNSWWGRWGNKPPPETRDDRLLLAGYLLNKGASIFGKAGYSRSVIGAAYGSGNGELVDFLLTNQMNRAACDQDGNTLIHLAAVWGRTNMLRDLAGRKLDLERTNNAGHTPLQAVSRMSAQSLNDRWVVRRPLPPLHSEGSKNRDQTFELLLHLGAKLDLLSLIALGRTNDVATLLASEPQSVRTRDGTGATPLHWAVQFGNSIIARMLITNRAELEITNAQGQTPLDLEATIGHIEIAKLLVEAGAAIKRPPGTRTALHSAAEHGFLDLAELFLDSGADLEAECDGHQTPSDLAARANKEKVVRFLIARKAKLKTGGDCVTTPLHWAVAHGNTNLATFLLDRRCDIRALNGEGRSVVHLAQAGNNFELIEFLLANGADINARDTNGNTALHLRMTAEKDVFPAPPTAAWRMSEKLKTKAWAKQHIPPQLFLASPTRSMMMFLINHGADPNATNLLGQAPLHSLAQRHFKGTNAVTDAEQWIRPLLVGGAKLNALDSKRQTPLHAAVLPANEPLMNVLIREGAKLDAQDSNGNTPLHLAATNIVWWQLGETGLVWRLELLLNAGAKQNIRNAAGMTPLCQAASNPRRDRSTEIVELLLRRKAPINLGDTNGRTPLHWACAAETPNRSVATVTWRPFGDATNKFEWWFGCRDEDRDEELEIPALLVGAGAKLNARDAQGNTPLHLATTVCRDEVVQWLVEMGADKKARNRAGKTPIEIAYDVVPGFTMIPFLQPPHASSEIADAARRGDIESVAAFLKDDPSYANWTWILETTPLQWACNEGQLEAVKLLLTNGAEVNPVVRYNPNRNHTNEANKLLVHQGEMQRRGILPRSFLTPMSRADQRTNYSGAETNLPPLRAEGHMLIYPGLTPLQLALAGGHTNIVELLLKRGAKTDTVSSVLLGRTDVLNQSVANNPELVKGEFFLGSWGWHWGPVGGHGMYSAANEYQGTLLHFAIRARQYEIAQHLLEVGADVHAKDFDGHTPHELADEQGDERMNALIAERLKELPKQGK